MFEIKREEASKIKNLFGYTNETFVLSFLQNHMGRGWVDDLKNPTCAKIIVGDFCFLAGNSTSTDAISLVSNIPIDYKSPYLLIIPENEMWAKIIESCYKDRYNKTLRYAIKKEPNCFNIENLYEFTKKPSSEFTIVPIDKNLYYKTLEEDFSKDLCSQFESAEDFLKRGIGFCILHNDKIVSGASSYTVYNSGIEIEVDTKNEYKNMALATACAAKLILECLKRNLYPSWDAHNKISVVLAEKLGYHFDYEYITYEVYNA